MTLSAWLLTWSVLVGDPTTPLPDPQCDPEDETSCVLYLSEGRPAPFEGILITLDRASRQTVRLEQCQQRIDLAREFAGEKAAIKIATLEALRASDRVARDAELDSFQRALEMAHEASQRPFLDHPAVWITVGVALAGITVGIATAIISETRPTVVTP